VTDAAAASRRPRWVGLGLAVVVGAIAGAAVAYPVTRVMTDRAVNSIADRAIELARANELRVLLEGRLDSRSLDRLGHAVMSRSTAVPGIVRVKVWTPDAQIRWSDESDLIGQRFPANQRVGRAVAGEVVASVRHVAGFEHLYEAEHGDLIEVYVPVRDAAGARVIGVFEVYARVDDLRSRTLRVWIASLGVGIALAVAVWLGAGRRSRRREFT
jgi:hypothetical protein